MERGGKVEGEGIYDKGRGINSKFDNEGRVTGFSISGVYKRGERRLDVFRVFASG